MIDEEEKDLLNTFQEVARFIDTLCLECPIETLESESYPDVVELHNEVDWTSFHLPISKDSVEEEAILLDESMAHNS
jgi:hypothetical protein